MRRLVFGALLTLCGVDCANRSEAGAQPSSSSASSAEAFSLPPEQRERIKVAAVAEAPFHRTVDVSGTVAFDQNSSTQVISAVSGPVTEILVPLGATVTAGTPLARVASPDYAAAVSESRKSTVAAGNLRRIADLDKKLFASGNIGRREMEQAEADASSAEAESFAASEALRALGSGPTPKSGRHGSVNDAIVRAPIDGTVVEQLINPGQLLDQGTTPCFTVARLSDMWIMASVFESDLPFVKEKDVAEIRVAGVAIPLKGTVDYVGDVVDPSTRAVPVRILADNPDRILKKDGYVDVAIHSSRESRGLVVPVSALLLDSESLSFVYVEDGGHGYARKRVTPGVRDGDTIEITNGLASGEKVVTDGGLFVQFAQNQ